MKIPITGGVSELPSLKMRFSMMSPFLVPEAAQEGQSARNGGSEGEKKKRKVKHKGCAEHMAVHMTTGAYQVVASSAHRHPLPNSP